MQIDEKNLNELKKQLEGDRERHLALYHQTIGGLLVIEHLEKSRQDHLTTEQLGEALGGTVEAIEPVKQDGADKNS